MCRICRLAWEGDPRVSARTQSSIIASADGETWLLLNASPDLRQQILCQPKLAAATCAVADARRASPVGAVLVTNGDVDHVAGLLTLRERQAFPLFATAGVHAILEANPVFQVLSKECVRRETVGAGVVFEPVAGLEAELFPVPGKVPLYLEGESVDVGEEGEMTVGVRLTAGGVTAFYIPGCARVTESLQARVAGADALLFDGTVYVDDEMEQAGVGTKTGRRMGHVPMTGEGGSLEAFGGIGIADRVYIHINNTNPVLVDGSEERDRVEASGWRIAHDGLEVLS